MNALLSRELLETTPTPVTCPMQRVVLTGYMGAGKSTVGRLLAERLGWQFCDMDHELEARHGCSIRDMFHKEGEAWFRRQEAAAVARALGRSATVVALGGGAIETLTNRLLLEQTAETAVIFLEAPFATLLDRCSLQSGASVRPVLADASAAADRYRSREPLYRRCARFHLATSSISAGAAAEAILRWLLETR